MRVTLTDRIVAAVSPTAGVRRIAARAAFNAASALTPAMSASSPTEPGGTITGPGGYRGGQSDRRQTRGWAARVRSANADGLGRQMTLIARSRDAAMNLPLGTAAIERKVTFAVGSGLMAMPEIDGARLGLSEDATNELCGQIARDFDAYMSSTDPDAERTATGYGLQEIVLRGVLESGDILGLRVMPEEQKGRRHMTAWALVEADRIVSPNGHREGDRLGGKGRNARSGPGTGNVCVGGVEVDGYNAPVRFHYLKKAPDAGQMTRRADDTATVEAWGATTGLPSALLVMAKRRPGQARGVPMLAPVLEVLKQISDLTEAELFAAVLQAMLAIVYKSPGATAMPEPDYEATGEAAAGLDNAARPQANYRLEAGSVMEIDSDAEVSLTTPGRPNPAFDPFFMALAKQLAAALEMPVELLMLAFTSSYSASRAALEVFYLTIRKIREWMSSHWCVPGYEAWLFEQVARGRYDMPGFLDDADVRALWSAVRFRGDGKISVDLGKEAKAFEIHEAHGWSTGQEITAQLNGGDYDSNIRRRAGEHKRFVAAGLPIPNAPGGGATPSGEMDGPEDAPADPVAA